MKPRLLIALKALKNPYASESYVFWIGLVMNLLSRYVPAVASTLDSFSQAAAGTDFSTFLAASLVYVVARMTKKAANVPPTHVK